MPKLTGIRITGNKYDGFQKRHEDSIFDLAPNGKGDHTLFTLQNGSGKGVMLQLIFQLMIPGTAWGKHKGNKLEGMFYNRYNVFKPYTFHVGLEWNLDEAKEKRLLTGICVSAYDKEIDEDEELRVGLKYFLYTHEYTGSSKFSLKNLPYYDQSRESTLPYKEMESFVEENKYYFVKYPKSSVRRLNSDYYQYLASHGIYRSEWEIMRTINRSEGGLDRYFSRARDNQDLFDKMIIPAVSESISNRVEESAGSLYNMFVDNIKIAKNLPRLISRSKDYKRLNDLVEPLLLDAEHGLKLQERKKAMLSRGDNLYRTIDNQLKFLENEIKSCEKDKKKTEDKIHELNFKRDNLKYARKTKRLKRERDKREKLLQNQNEIERKIDKLQEQEKKLKLNSLYLPYQKKKKEFKHTQKRIQELQKSLGLKKLREKMSRVKDKIKSSWPELKKNWRESLLQINGYIKDLEQTIDSLELKEKEIKDNIRNLERKIDRFLERKKRFKKWEDELSEKYNPLQLSSPAYLVGEIEDEIKSLENRRKKFKVKIEKNKEKMEKKQNRLTQLQMDLRQYKNEYDSLKESFEERKKEENKLKQQLIKILNLDKFSQVYNKKWLREKKAELDGLITAKKEKKGQLSTEARQLKNDLALNDSEYWIANSEQKRLYNSIREMDIKVFYGSDFLLNVVEEENKKEMLEKYPFLLHSLVLMYEGDWQKVKKNLTGEEVFRSAVPIFINYQRDQYGENGFRLVHGKELEFIEDPEKFTGWYNGLKKKKAEFERTVETLEKKLNTMRHLSFTAESLLKEKPSQDIREKMDVKEKEIESLKNKIEKAEQKKIKLKEEEKKLKNKLARWEKKINKKSEDFTEIKNFRDEKEEMEKERENIEDMKDKLEKYEGLLAENEADQNEYNKLKLNIELRQENWEKDQKVFVSELQELIPEAVFPGEVDKKSSPDTPEFYDYRDSKTNYYYQKLQDLRQKEEDKEKEITFLRKDLNRLREEIVNTEQELEDIDLHWADYEFTVDNIEEVRIKLERVRKNLTDKKNSAKNLNKKIDQLVGVIKTLKETVDEIYEEISAKYNKAPRAWAGKDLDRKEYTINQKLQENGEYLKKLKQMINEYEQNKNNLKSQLGQLNFYDLDPARGEMNSTIKDRVRENPEEVVEGWTTAYGEIEDKLNDLKEKIDEDHRDFKYKIEEDIESGVLRSNIQEKIISDFVLENFQNNYEMLSSFKEHLNNELNRLKDDRSEAEEARRQWAERSAMHVIRLVKSMKEMISNMVYHNQSGHAFPLVKLKRDDFLPDREEDIIPELEEYFVEVIKEINEKGIEIDSLTENELEEYIGDAALFSRTVRGQYPRLQVYKMTERNEFLNNPPRDYYYADWEAVIKGKGDTAEGSGGQSLSINAFMMMMLLNYRKQRLDKNNPWTVMFLDNPFGEASAAHVLDPIFKIADKLNFQIIAFAAPEIIKTEISQRFPVFWALEIASDTKGYGVIEGKVMYGERVRNGK